MDRERPPAVVGDKLPDAVHGRPPRGQDAAHQGGADRGGVTLVGAQQTALLEIEHIRCALKGEVVLECALEAQHGRHRPAGDKGVCTGCDARGGCH